MSALFLFSFFVHSHSRTRGAQMVSQRETQLAAVYPMLLYNSTLCSKNANAKFCLSHARTSVTFSPLRNNGQN